MFYQFRFMNFSAAEEFFKCKPSQLRRDLLRAVFVGCLTCSQSPSRASNSPPPLFFVQTLLTFCGFLQFLNLIRHSLPFCYNCNTCTQTALFSYLFGDFCSDLIISAFLSLQISIKSKKNLHHLCFSCSYGEVP